MEEKGIDDNLDNNEKHDNQRQENDPNDAGMTHKCTKLGVDTTQSNSHFIW